MERLEAVLKRINAIALDAATVLFVVAFIAIVVQVLTRYLLRFSFPWIEELARYLTIYMVLLASGYLLKKGENPFVEIVYQTLSPSARRWLNFIFYTLIAAFLVFLLVNGVATTLNALNKRTPSLRMSWAIAYSAVPVGALLMLLQMPYLFVHNYRHGATETDAE